MAYSDKYALVAFHFCKSSPLGRLFCVVAPGQCCGGLPLRFCMAIAEPQAELMQKLRVKNFCIYNRNAFKPPALDLYALYAHNPCA